MNVTNIARFLTLKSDCTAEVAEYIDYQATLILISSLLLVSRFFNGIQDRVNGEADRFAPHKLDGMSLRYVIGRILYPES